MGLSQELIQLSLVIFSAAGIVVKQMGLVMQFSEGDRAGDRKRAVVVVGNQLGTASDNRACKTGSVERGTSAGADAGNHVNGNPPLGAGEDDIRREADAPPFENELAEIDKRSAAVEQP